MCLFLNVRQWDSHAANGDVLLGDCFAIAGVLDRDERVEYWLEGLREEVDDRGWELAMMVGGCSTMAYQYRTQSKLKPNKKGKKGRAGW